MTSLIHLKASIAAVAAVGVVAGGAGQAFTGPTLAAAQQDVKAPQLKKDGELKVKGTHASETIVLRLRARDPATVEVDLDGDGSADYSFPRSEITKIRVKAGPGNDTVRIDEANGVFTDTIPTTLDGGAGNDSLAGGSGAETLRGGSGNDTIDGNRGDDTALMGAGDDLFIWDPGDGSDVVEGQDGSDTMRFNGAGAGETVDVSANGDRVVFHREPVNITMDTAGLERIDFIALGGADVVTVNDLAGTGLANLNVDEGVGDAAADRVIVNATAGDDAIKVAGDASSVDLTGLAAAVGVTHPEAAKDSLEVNTLAGTDSVDSSGLAAGAIKLFVDGALKP
jgi:Ca2+-binding RTX toxin-like protein